MGTEQEEASRRLVGQTVKEKRISFWSSREVGSMDWTIKIENFIHTIIDRADGSMKEVEVQPNCLRKRE
jgi:hypothetical protein